MKKLIALISITILLISATGCGEKDDSSHAGETSNRDFQKNDYKKMISSNNELGFDLLATTEPDDNGNTFISPTSLLMALSMVYNGAVGETKEEIADVLQVEGIDVGKLNKANASLISIMNNDSDQVQLDIANSIWLNKRFQFQDDFAKNNKSYFNAEIQEINVDDRKSAEKINDWVRKATNYKIDKIADSPLDSDMVTMLINAIYFQGEWTNEFDEKETADRTFYLADGATKDAPLMKQKRELAYMENDNFQAVSLPYGEDGEMSMNIFLPKKNIDMIDFQEMLTNENWAEWKSEFQRKKGTIMLPKFQLEYEATLNEPLQRLGMTTAFDKDEARFERLIEEDAPLWISKVKQKTFIDVNETGTEAAGVTSIEIVTESSAIQPDDDSFYMEVNRPFFISITEEETDAILFMGTIFNP
ncbi:serpin B [Virgibacillus halotolerans]|uniref:serpin family protein n=1 Tax=Virgibacillus halotolerans TaxID=1071053 RepID=UPI00195F4258|nr:serpin family protein [Virgibacillus halotolerans]MBM7599588.1 serpin B [Virgibacillus halotolerans]